MNTYFSRLIFLVVFASGCQSCQAAEAPKKPKLTLEYAVNDIIQDMDSENLEKVKNTKPIDLYQYHLGWGSGIRNHYGMWKEKSELVFDICGDECDPDDASMFVIRGVWNKLNGYDIRSEEGLIIRTITKVYDDEPEVENP